MCPNPKYEQQSFLLQFNFKPILNQTQMAVKYFQQLTGASDITGLYLQMIVSSMNQSC